MRNITKIAITLSVALNFIVIIILFSVLVNSKVQLLGENITDEIELKERYIYVLFNSEDETSNSYLASYDEKMKLNGVFTLDGVYDKINIYGENSEEKGIVISGNNNEICFEGDLLQEVKCPEITSPEQVTELSKSTDTMTLMKNINFTSDENSEVFLYKNLKNSNYVTFPFKYEKQIIDGTLFIPSDFDSILIR